MVNSLKEHIETPSYPSISQLHTGERHIKVYSENFVFAANFSNYAI